MKMIISDEGLFWVSALLSDRLGLEIRLNKKENHTELTFENHETKCLIKNNPISLLNNSADVIPVSFGVIDQYDLKLFTKSIIFLGHVEPPEKLFEFSSGNLIINYDIVELIFYKLNLVEEQVDFTYFDSHERVQSNHLHASINGYLHRPIVDEWIELFMVLVKRSIPGIKFKPKSFKLNLSHDVDRPFQYKYDGPFDIFRQMFGDVYKRKSLITCMNRFSSWGRVKLRGVAHDPYNTFGWIMDCAESSSFKCQFNFLACGRNSQYDGRYSLEEKDITDLLKSIHDRGHEIGLHISYDGFNQYKLVNDEFKKLVNACESVGIQQDSWKARTHYLRWDHVKTLPALDIMGLSADNSLGFSDCCGFRCGTSVPYKAFDLKSNQILNIVIEPLIVMDHALGLENLESFDEAQVVLNNLLYYHKIIKHFGGALSLLWHNSFLNTQIQRSIFQSFLRQVG